MDDPVTAGTDWKKKGDCTLRLKKEMADKVQKRKWMGFAVFVMLFAFLGSWNTVVHADEVKNGWVGSYYYVDGVKQKSTWIKDGSNTYYLKKNGKKATGWLEVDDSYYFFNEKGKLYNSNRNIGVKLSQLSDNVITMGIDVSEWQGNVDWAKVKSAGVEFVMIRLGYGKGRYGSTKHTMDNKFKEYVEGAKEAGIPIGIYFYSYATTPEQALSEAEFTIQNLKGIPVEFPVAYDIEDSYIVNNTTTEVRTQMAKTYMDTIAAAGYYPVYYCNQTWYNNYLNSETLANYDFWYARYTYEEPSNEEYPFTMWQATSTQTLSGITENTVDIDFLYEDYFTKVTARSNPMKYGWHEEDGKLRYYYRGKTKKGGWLSIGGKKYYFVNGEACRGWKTIKGKKYYFNKKGEMRTGIIKVSGKRYMLGSNGVLQMQTNEQGIRIDENGVCHITAGWYKDSNGKYFYRKSNGSRAGAGWLSVNNKKYYCDKNGYRVTGFQTINKKRYYFNKKTGVMKKGWLKLNGKSYYFYSSGQMVRGKTITIKGKKYTFKSNGVLKK